MALISTASHPSGGVAMFKRGYRLAACGALALLLTAAETCPAQFVSFPVGRGGTIGSFGRAASAYFPIGPYYGRPTTIAPPTATTRPSTSPATALTTREHGRRPSTTGPPPSRAATRRPTPRAAPRFAAARHWLRPDGRPRGAGLLPTPIYPLRSPDYNVDLSGVAAAFLRRRTTPPRWKSACRPTPRSGSTDIRPPRTGPIASFRRRRWSRARITSMKSAPAGTPTASRSIRRAKSPSTPAIMCVVDFWQP